MLKEYQIIQLRKYLTKKAVSPIITTILLVLIAIILAIIILVWARGFIKESLTKFDEPIERACDDVNLQVSVSGNELIVINQGDVPVYKLGMRIVKESGTEVVESTETNFLPGSTRTIHSEGSVENIIPILLGTDREGTVKQYSCPKSNWISLE